MLQPLRTPPRWTGPLLIAAVSTGLFLLIATYGGPSAGQTVAVKAAPFDLVTHVLITLCAVIALGHLLGWLCRYIGQPPVIGEVLAGIALGPSLLGAIAPEAARWLIPGPDVDAKGQVAAAFKGLSQIGVLLYMFLVGLELNAARLASRGHTLVFISGAGIAVPFVCGATLAIGLHSGFAPAGIPFPTFALFMGVALSITAFPVLARILADRKLDKTDLGLLALGCAAADDVTAWCLLALAVGVAQSQLSDAVLVATGAMVFVAVMILVVAPIVTRWSRQLDETEGPLPPSAVAVTFLLVLLSALATEMIGVHALFGAFFLGVVIPSGGRLAHDFTAKLHDPVTVLLLPAFFAYTGLRTQIGLVGSLEEWLICLAIIAVATLGKLGGITLAARWTGQSWRESFALGSLMNTRGLMELIVLNIGLDLGVISPRLFAMMVLMAIATTMATAPLLRLIGEKSEVTSDE